MKLNWGSGIAIFYSVFVLILVGFVVYASQQGVNMVDRSYYDQDMAYEEFRQKRNRGRKLASSIKLEVKDAGKLVIGFPQQMKVESGHIHLYRPANHFDDKKINLQSGQNEIEVDISGLPGGIWLAKVDWVSDGQSYFIEKDLHFE